MDLLEAAPDHGEEMFSAPKSRPMVADRLNGISWPLDGNRRHRLENTEAQSVESFPDISSPAQFFEASHLRSLMASSRGSQNELTGPKAVIFLCQCRKLLHD
jgi:hypothetical protein